MTSSPFRSFALAAALATALAAPAHAGPVGIIGAPNTFTSYFGHTSMPGGAINGEAKVAYDLYQANMLSTSTHGFEGVLNNTRIRDFTAEGGFGATKIEIEGEARTGNGAGNAFGRFATDGTQWLEVVTSTITFDFSVNPLKAFGMLLTDLGDFENSVQVDLIAVDGTEKTFDPTLQLSKASGNLTFWGFTDTTGQSYKQLVIRTVFGSVDRFGIDSVVLGEPLVNSGVPVPGTLALLGVAGLAFAGTRRRRA
jgi:hypothetical protein